MECDRWAPVVGFAFATGRRVERAGDAVDNGGGDALPDPVVIVDSVKLVTPPGLSNNSNTADDDVRRRCRMVLVDDAGLLLLSSARRVPPKLVLDCRWYCRTLKLVAE